MRLIMRFIAAVLASQWLAASAVTSTTDFSDLWYASPAESEEGWGVNVIQQRDILFITLFVYNANGQPVWYVGPATRFVGTSQDGALAFTGPLFATTGPWFGAPAFDSNAVTARQVGTVVFQAGQISNGTLTYTVDGVTVSKPVIRQSWEAENLQGIYVGASLAGFAPACTGQGYRESSATITVTHAGLSAITLVEETPAYTCTYVGAYSQVGRMGEINASGTCTDGTTPTFHGFEVQGGIEALTMRYRNTYPGGCFSAGRMGGVRRGS
jgi:hypothetical protein